ncbi:MAG: amidophosphoribosyltransferase [Halothiobacillaceae bacterium]|nr:amidophosphoribosyltransferase [Halothiobacillaceae bacterium]
MCGIIGVVGRGPVNQTIYDGLTLLQHRGQDAAGILTCDGERLFLRKDNGLVKDVFHTRHMRQLFGNMGIGHVRYPTAGCDSTAEAQPFYVNAPYGIALGHNGNLTNVEELRHAVIEDDRRHLNTSSDSEVLLNVFAHELDRCHSLHPSAEDIFSAVTRVHERIRGAYGVIALIAGQGILAFRDPYGIRPVCYGSRETDNGTEYLVASESVAIEALGFTLIRDLAPGEAIYITVDGVVSTRQCAPNAIYSPCIFEFVYLARPDSIIDEVSVYRARMRMGEKLAAKIQREWVDHDIDVVIPIPDTSRTAALEIAVALNVKYREGFIKNRYIGRTFIMPGQSQRKKSVRQKLNAIDLEFRGKNVLLVDDSIVRGTTSEEIIRMAREAGARKVYMASAAPPVRYPNVYGIDMPAACELIAHGRTEDEVATAIGADRLIYQDIDDLIEAVRAGNPALKRFDCSCFTGEYVTGDVDGDYLRELADRRGDKPGVAGRSRDIVAVGLHNAE